MSILRTPDGIRLVDIGAAGGGIIQRMTETRTVSVGAGGSGEVYLKTPPVGELWELQYLWFAVEAPSIQGASAGTHSISIELNTLGLGARPAAWWSVPWNAPIEIRANHWMSAVAPMAGSWPMDANLRVNALRGLRFTNAVPFRLVWTNSTNVALTQPRVFTLDALRSAR